ncbi:DUF3387 domain-containing protein [Acrocarpospora macrocephala]|nr:DUF3387 domain-containing protein [Acrocarpospora macrocephala]
MARYNYPLDHEGKVIELVLRQMEHFAGVWSKDGTR